MKIALFEVEQWERKAFERLDGGYEITYTGDPLTAQNAARYADAEIISTFIYSKIDCEAIRSFRSLRLIATRSTGFEHIDLPCAAQNNVQVCNVPAYGDYTVAEHVFGLILALSRRLVDAAERTRKGRFSQQGLRGFDLYGKTLGVLGTGKIGRCVIEIARGFHMNVLAYDLYPNEEAARRMGFRYLPLDDVLSKSDIITLHLPSNAQTHNFLSAPRFDMMKKGVMIINTARGTLIDIHALLHAITSGKVGSAGLDVLPEEPAIMEEAELLRSIAQKKPLETLLADHILLRMDNVIITPHIAFNTREAVERILDTTIDNIASFVRGEPKNLVMAFERR